MDLLGRAKKALPWIAVVAVIAVIAVPAGAFAAITWGSPKLGHAQPGNTWLDGPPAYQITNTPTEGPPAQTLHATFMSDKLPGEPSFPAYQCGATEGPFSGAFYAQSANAGTSWTPAFRLSSESANAEGHGLATDGDTLIASYRELNCYYAYGAAYRNTPSVVYTRTSLDNGSTWMPPVRITAPKKQVPDYPYLDAEYDGPQVLGGPDLWVMSFTNGQNGLVKVAVSDDAGMTWSKHNAGQTANKVYPGLGGNTAVAVTGDDIGVAWMDAPGQRIMANFSQDGGETWDEPFELSEGSATAPNGRGYSMSADAVNGRIGFSWIDDTSVKYQEFDVSAKSLGGGGSTTVTGFPDGFSPVHNAGRDPMVQLRGSDYVGISYAGCRQANCATSASSLIDLMYQESDNNGADFGAQTRPAAGAVGTSQMNQWPSLVWVDDSTRWVAYANWQSGYSNYRVLVRQGTGNEFPV